MANVLRVALSYWKSLVLVLAPLLLLPLPVSIGTQPANCAYVILLTAIFWMTETMPIAITSLLPALLLPCLGVASIEDISQQYLRQTNMLFIGSLIIAVAVEDSMLHKRIALRVLMLVGTQLKWLLLGCMCITAFLSMWITNTSTTAMMLPIMLAILGELEDIERVDGGEATTTEQKSSADDSKIEMALKYEQRDEDTIRTETPQLAYSPATKKQQAMRRGFVLAVAYSANIGGTGSLTGTGPNLELAGQLNTFYGHGVHGVNFASWFFFCFPNTILSLLVAWIWLLGSNLGWREIACWGSRGKKDSTIQKEKIQCVIQNLYKGLGPMSFQEKSVLSLFTGLALLWITRDPQFIPGARGWDVPFVHGYVTDATAALFVSILFFILPKEWPHFTSSKTTPKLLTWEKVHHRLPWNVVLLMGAGFAIAFSVKHSGLSSLIGEQLLFLGNMPVALLLLVLCTLAACITELASNTAIATIIIPILVELSYNLQVHPLYLMLPTVISTSFAFMLPVATPPNALVFASGHLKIMDMVKSGIVMNVICIGVLQFSLNTYGIHIFQLNEFPEWAARTASSTAAVTIQSTTMVSSTFNSSVI